MDGDSIISGLTYSLLKGTGWYNIDPAVAKETTWGKGAKCDFINKPC